MTDCLLTLNQTEALAIGHQTIDLMGGHKIIPSAQNYEVWLAYRLGALSELRKEIDERLARGEQFTDVTNQQLHERYFSNARLTAQMVATGERIARELNGVITAINAAGESATDYGAELEAASQRLAHGVSVDMLREMIENISRSTAKMVDENKELTQQLQRSSRDMDDMRRTLRQVRAEAMTDSLTGLANRKLFDETLRNRLREASVERTPLCLLLCDIDHFKRFNDTWGHLTGDQIIRFVSSTLQRFAPPGGLAARYGGEEFALVLPRMTLSAARELGERIRTTIESKTLVRKSTGEDLGRITVSSGVALARLDETPSSFIERADACLYVSKRTGRNRITSESDPAALNAA
ncbi:MAG: GGDEF domain-containing protein [Hyphomonadaceae bacterium]|nr:GGDEF domain-containing protein [Hyphomonadaceae bacterium]